MASHVESYTILWMDRIYEVVCVEKTKTNINIGTGLLKYRLVFAAAAFTAGILLGSVYTPLWMALFGGFGLSAIFIFLKRRDKRFVFFGGLAVVFLLGVLNYRFAEQKDGITMDGIGKLAKVECVITEDPVYRKSYTQYEAVSRELTVDGKRYKNEGGFFLRIKGKADYQYGDRLLINGTILEIGGKRNPGDFDFERYYKSRGIYGIINAEDTVLIQHDGQNPLAAFFHALKNKVKSIIFQALPETEAAVLYGILTGDKGEMEEDIREAYARTGLSHILSVSGLHVGFLMLFVQFFLKPLKLDARLESGTIVLAILCYILMIGAPLPALRAFIMLLVLLAGKMLGRQYDLLISVSFAAFSILLFNPMAVHDPGFVISFTTMYSIALLQQPVYKCLKILPLCIRDTFALSLAVWIGIAPVLAGYFNYISLISIFINLLAVPIAFLITLAGFAGAVLGAFLPRAALYVFSTAYYLIRLLNLLTLKSAALPFAGFYVPSLPVYMHILYLITVAVATNCFGLNYLRIYKSRAVVWCGLLCLLAFLVYIIPGDSLKIVFFDIGQGDSACIITPEKRAILIDGGGSPRGSDYYYDVGGKITLPALLRQGIWHIDTIVASHLHDDHIEGLLQVLKVYKPDRIVFPEGKPGKDHSACYYELLSHCKANGIRILYMGKGDEIRFGDSIKLEVLSPDAEADEASGSENNRSLIIRFVYKRFETLFTGDIDSGKEMELISGELKADVLKVAHHGSGYSTNEAFLKAVSPRLGIISVGKNIYGHPSSKVLERLKQSGCKAYRTDESGAVIVTTNGNSMKVKTVRQN